MDKERTTDKPWWYSKPKRDPGECVWDEGDSFWIMSHGQVCQAIGLGDDDWPCAAFDPYDYRIFHD